MGKKLEKVFFFPFLFKKTIVQSQMDSVSAQAVEKNLYFIY